MVQEEIDKNSRNAHVQPDGKRPSGPSAMPVDLARQSQIECSRHKQGYRHCKHDVRHQHDEVDTPDPSFSAKGCVHASDEDLVSDVSDQKKCGDKSG